MIGKHPFRSRNAVAGGASLIRNLMFRNEGAQLLEFALVLPFLLVFVVGIFDFAQAYNLKQKLNNATREAARFAANENSGGNNLSVNGVSDVSAIRDVVATYLTDAGVTQCTIAASPTVSGGVFIYTFSSSSTGCASFSLVINRGYVVTTGPPAIFGTHVTLTYPYTWSFGPIIRLLVPTSALSLPVSVSTESIMQNIN